MIKILILAAGKGTRMNSDLPKCLHKVYDKTMIEYIINTCSKITTNINVIVGHKSNLVEEVIKPMNVNIIHQEELLGTAHAVIQAINIINDEDTMLILNADMPLITVDSLNKVIELFKEEKKEGIVVSSIFNKYLPYGRIIKDSNNNLIEIVEENECTNKQLSIKEVNVGIYCFNGKYLKLALNKITTNKKEMYLTDVPYYINQLGGKILVYLNSDFKQFQGVNTKEELLDVTRYMLDTVIKRHIENGVNFIDRNNVYIGTDVVIKNNVTIYPNVFISNNCLINENTILYSGTNITSSTIGANCIIENSKINKSIIGNNCTIGPFSNIRQDCIIKDNIRIGSFVELKNSYIDNNTKIPHLSYIGDTTIGTNVEVACGVITCNMNTKYKKNKTTIEDNAFIGANSILVAPIKVGSNSLVGAGSVITSNVEDNDLVLTRANLITKKDYNKEN